MNEKLRYEITADTTQAARAVRTLGNNINGIGGGFTKAFGGAIPTMQLAGAAIGSVALAVGGAASALFSLTKAASDYGSEIFDASQKTGQSAEVLSALKYAADQSGSSFEQVTGSVAKFTVLLGEARGGSEKAQATLDKYGITAKSVDGALVQSVKTIIDLKDADLQAAAAKALFKDRTSAILPVIKSFDGDLPALIEKLRNLGVLMSDQDAVAADQFGDTLDLLTKQASAVGRQFAFEMMPQMTNAMASISAYMSQNQGVASGWGLYVVNVVSGVITTFNILSDAGQRTFNILTLGFGTSAAGAMTWATGIRTALDFAFAGLPSIVANLAAIGWNTNPVASGQGMWLDHLATPKLPSVTTPKIPKATRAAAGAAAPDNSGREAQEAFRKAEEIRRKKVQAAEDEVNKTLEIFRAGYDERQAIADAAFEREEISEMTHLATLAKIRLDAKEDERRLLQGIINDMSIPLVDEEYAELQQKIKVLTIEIRTEKLKGGTEVVKQIKKEVEANEELLKKEKERLRAIKERRQLADFEFLKWKRDQKEKEEIERKQKVRNTTVGSGGAIGAFDQIRDHFAGSGNTAALAGIDALTQALDGMGQALGQVVSAWVLYGSAGQSARQVTAQILAGIAQQATVKAVFELAEGFAALAMSFFGMPNAGPSAAAHFTAAAIYGGIAGGAAIAGRAVAGDSFKDKGSSSASSGASAGAASGGNDRPAAYSRVTANAFTSGNRNENDRLASAIEQLNSNLTSMSPGDVLVAGSRQKRGFVGKQAVSDMASDNKIAREAGRTIGLR